VQRRARGAWRTVGTGTVLGGQAEVVVVLPRGDQRLRVVLTIGAQELVSPARGVKLSIGAFSGNATFSAARAG
jgi:hypothetical protein